MPRRVSMYLRGRKFCPHCGPPQGMGAWKPADRIENGICKDCGYPVRNSPKAARYKARVRGYEGQYSQIKAGVLSE